MSLWNLVPPSSAASAKAGLRAFDIFKFEQEHLFIFSSGFRYATAEHEERTATLCESAISCLSLQIITYMTCLQMATGAEKATWKSKGHLWLQIWDMTRNSSHKQRPSGSTKTRRKCNKTGRTKKNASSTQIRLLKISQVLTLTVHILKEVNKL